MERLVFQAAQEGNVISLRGLLQEDPLILDRLLANCFPETPLHVAAILGHVSVVEEILRRKPQLARELNLNKSTPLHLASARGFIDVVKALISVDPEMCLALDKDGRNPLHVAAMKGRVDVLKELLQAKPDAARATVHRGETILHVCVIHNQFEALKLLVDMTSDKDFLNAEDDDGNTILHLAVADKQIETINYLLINTDVEVNTLNLHGLTSMDILSQSRRDGKDIEIRESLSRAGAIGAKVSSQRVTKRAKPNRQKNNFEDFLKLQQDWLERKRNSLMVVASLIATMAFQAGLNPPGGSWQETKKVDSQQQGGEPVELRAGHSIWADTNPTSYGGFLIFNTLSLIASLSIILLLISGLPIRRRVFVWILMVIMWIAITAVTLTYVFSILKITDLSKDKTTVGVIGYVLFIWLALMGLLLLGHSIRLIIRMVKALRKLVKRKRPELNSGIASSADRVQMQMMTLSHIRVGI